MKVRLTTNGWNLPGALLERVKEGVVEQVNVSIDGSSPSAHDAFRDKPGSFERAMSAIPKLKDSGLKALVINSCVGAGRVGDMDAIVRLAIQFQCNRVSFKALLNVGRNDVHAGSRVLSVSEMNLFQQERERLRSKYGHLIEIEGHLITENVPDNLIDEVACNAGTSAMTVGADGSMYPCEIISPFVVAPNTRRVPPAQAWTENAVFKEFRVLRAGSVGGCGTLGCPGSRMPNQHLTTIAGT
jgi:MoaA/NifB/PqqE/SkfB family radical SAM enzyme